MEASCYPRFRVVCPSFSNDGTPSELRSLDGRLDPATTSRSQPRQRVITPTPDDALSPEDRHGMNKVIASMEKQKQADEATLKTCLADK